MAKYTKFKTSQEDEKPVYSKANHLCCIGDCNMLGTFQWSAGWVCRLHYGSSVSMQAKITDLAKSQKYYPVVDAIKKIRKGRVTKVFDHDGVVNQLRRAGLTSLEPSDDEMMHKASLVYLLPWLNRLEAWLKKNISDDAAYN